ncbi:MAG: hypothetical protein WDW36_007890 [Sanguina aurantia]
MNGDDPPEDQQQSELALQYPDFTASYDPASAAGSAVGEQSHAGPVDEDATPRGDRQFNSGVQNYKNWSQAEDSKLSEMVAGQGPKDWHLMADELPGRTSKSCRLRFMNQLRPDINNGPFALHEDTIILQLHALHGNKWTFVASQLAGRTDNQVKNRWHSHLKKLTQTERAQLLASGAAAVASGTFVPSSQQMLQLPVVMGAHALPAEPRTDPGDLMVRKGCKQANAVRAAPTPLILNT